MSADKNDGGTCGSQDRKIDPDPFLLAALCLQGAAVILQFVQVRNQRSDQRSSPGAIESREDRTARLEDALEAFDKSIQGAERAVRRSSEAPEKELYESSFRVSLGVLNFSARHVQEYHNNLADIAGKLSALTRWVGSVISTDPELASELGEDLVAIVDGAAERLNALMSEGAEIEAVMQEAKMVRDACKRALEKRLDNRNS